MVTEPCGGADAEAATVKVDDDREFLLLLLLLFWLTDWVGGRKDSSEGCRWVDSLRVKAFDRAIGEDLKEARCLGRKEMTKIINCESVKTRSLGSVGKVLSSIGRYPQVNLNLLIVVNCIYRKVGVRFNVLFFSCRYSASTFFPTHSN
ncbi:translation elongation factor EF1A [Striga asiatica]|uniref:Translation elongation factor EF1A n=1 Tax=Striga asiatica TaxID=4170 RepID=A0A5A7R2Q8_STRAF|nr:translation elongation factor EF1A [Striga asiatica]